MTIITALRDLEELCDRIDRAGRFAMDLEFIPERTYDPELCLVQVATDEGAYIIDPVALPQLDSLWLRVADPDILVVLHAAEQDLDLIYRFSGQVPQNVMDIQIGAGFAGFGYPVGYGKLLHQLLGISISKTESYTDWLARPLTESQIDYALDDVRHILPMHDRLVARLTDAKRLTWVKEECTRYHSQEYYLRDASRAYLKIRGASALSRRGLAVLQALCEWRENTAHRANRPIRSILPDNILLELSRRPPERMEDIQRIRGVRPDQQRAYVRDIISSVESAKNLPEAQCPVWPSSRVPPRREVLQVDLLFTVLKVICYDLNLAPELVATRGDLQLLAASFNRGELNPAQHHILLGWRYEMAGRVMLDLLNGATLELQFSQAEHPVTMEVRQVRTI